MSLIPTMRFRLAPCDDLVDLNGIDALAGIERQDGHIRIGAMTRHVAVAESPEVRGGRSPRSRRSRVPSATCRCATAAPSAARSALPTQRPTTPAGLLGLGATVSTDRRTIAADDFFTGLYETALVDGEIVVSVDFPIPERAGWAKFGNQASRFAVVAVMVSQAGGRVRLAVTGARSHVFRVPEMEAALAANFTEEAVSGIAVDSEGLNEDLHADRDYRAHLVGVMAKRAVREALAP